MTHAAARRDAVPLREATKAWFAISLQTFGGPAGQIAVMQRTLVDEKRWIGDRRFLHALSYCMLLPGPEAHQLAIYTGWLLNGAAGGLIAGVLFVLPGLVAMLALSAIYVAFGDVGLVEAVFASLAPAVLAVVVQAVLRIGGRVLTGRWYVAIAVGAFLALTVLHAPFPLVIALAAAVGWLVGRTGSSPAAESPAETADAHPPLIPDDALHIAPARRGRTLAILAIGIPLWLGPVALAIALGGADGTLAQQGVFFSGAALVTFGGAYAVLAYVAQRAVETYGWVTATEMARGLALAETTPGPLIMVVQFVAFLGAYAHPGSLDPWVAAVVASFLVTWVTFVPSFLFIFVGAPYVERLRGNRTLAAALRGVTAAVVGVIGSLAVYLAARTLFAETVPVALGPVTLELPVLGTLLLPSLGIAVAAAVMIFALRWSVLRTIGVSAVLGVALSLLPIA